MFQFLKTAKHPAEMFSGVHFAEGLPLPYLVFNYISKCEQCQ